MPLCNESTQQTHGLPRKERKKAIEAGRAVVGRIGWTTADYKRASEKFKAEGTREAAAWMSTNG